MLKAWHRVARSKNRSSSRAKSSKMSPAPMHVSWSVYETVPLAFLISTPKALRILLVHKIREPRFQLLLFNWAFALLALLCASICGFSFMPMFLAVGVVAEGFFLFSWCFSSTRETCCWISPSKMSSSSSWRSDATLWASSKRRNSLHLNR